MAGSDTRDGYFNRVIRFALGIGLGVGLGVLIYRYLSDRLRAQRAQAPADLSQRPQQAIVLPHPSGSAIQAPSVPLSVKAHPARFARGKQGTIRVEAPVGATCTIKALYSTGQSPSSLDPGPVEIGQDGKHEWGWRIGTSGTHVDVTVQAQMKGYQESSTALRVQILDA